MRRLLVAAALAAAISTSALAAESYTGQIVGDDNGRQTIVVVKRGDTIWKLCIRYDWCRAQYPEQRKDWGDFLAHVSALNGGKDMNLLYVGELIKFPLSVGAAKAFGELDWTIKNQNALYKGLNAKATQLAAEKGLLASKVEEQAGIINSMTATASKLANEVKELMGLNDGLKEQVADLQQANTVQNGEISTLKTSVQSYRYSLTGVFIVLLLGSAGALLFYYVRNRKASRPALRPAPALSRAG